MNQTALEQIEQIYPYYLLDTTEADTTPTILLEGLLPILRTLHQEHSMTGLSHMYAAPTGQDEEPFAVYYRIFQPTHFGMGECFSFCVRCDKETVLPSIEELYPTATWFEREVHEMAGLSFDAEHISGKWLLHPQRIDFPQQAGASAPQYGAHPRPAPSRLPSGPQEDGSFVTIEPWLPAQSTLPQSIGLQLALASGAIVDCDPQIGLGHRGLEQLAQAGTWEQWFHHAERVGLHTGTMYAIAYAMLIESMADIQPSSRVSWLRMLFLEISRILSHSHLLARSLHIVGPARCAFPLEQLAESCRRILNTYTGSRLGTGVHRPGGLLRHPYNGFYEDIFALQQSINWNVQQLQHDVLSHLAFQQRTTGIACFSPNHARKLGLMGFFGRASGIPCDLRKTHPYLHYDQLQFDQAIGSNGDIFDRLHLACAELLQSASILVQAAQRAQLVEDEPLLIAHPLVETRPLEANQETPVLSATSLSNGGKLPPGTGSIQLEGANSVLSLVCHSDGSGSPMRLYIEPSGYHMMQLLPQLLRGQTARQVELVLASLPLDLGEIER
jgi:NADH:ubiquinone oxidoreductase subunit D/NADH:ubiquinone oxidoreductase subunit C